MLFSFSKCYNGVFERANVQHHHHSSSNIKSDDEILTFQKIEFLRFFEKITEQVVKFLN